MTIDQWANQDFERAVRRGFWRKILTMIKRDSNELLPFDEVREKLKIQGQHYDGLKEVPIDLVVGSVGRYRDFDRIFLPKQRRTKDRWVNINKAHYEQINLPPVELYQIGEIYFVKDGNHRVSVARERGQEFIDAYVTVIDLPIWLSLDTKVDDLDLKEEYANFVLQTGINKLVPGSDLEANVPGVYGRLLEHIDVHRWYLGENRESEIPYQDAVLSWYQNVYLPVIEFIRQNDLQSEFPNFSLTDLYLWIMEYAGYVQRSYKTEEEDAEDLVEEAAEKLIQDYQIPAVRKVVKKIKKDEKVNQLILLHERNNFLERTRIFEIRPDAQIDLTIPGFFDRLFEHIAVHQWYLGEKKEGEVEYSEAIASWYDNVYLPVIQIIREQEIMKLFPGRTETDLYVWIVNRRSILEETYGREIPIEKAAETIAEDADKL